MVDMAAKGGMDNTARDALSLNIRDWSLDFNQDQKICKRRRHDDRRRRQRIAGS